MGQQAGHAQRRVGRQHAKLGRQFGLEAILAVQFLRQFLGRFVAEGIADDDEDFAVLGFVQPPLDVPLVELVLIRHLVDPPALQEARAARRIDECAPGQGEVREIPVDVDGFDLLPQRLEHIPILGFGDSPPLRRSADTTGRT